MAGTISNPAGSVTTGYSVPASLFIADAGTEGAPSYTFSGDLNTGMFSPGADQLGLTTGGTLRWSVSTTAITSTLPETAPSFTVNGSTIPTNGLYLPAANTVGVATNGTLRVSVSTTAVTSTLPITATGQIQSNSDTYGFRLYNAAGTVSRAYLWSDGSTAQLASAFTFSLLASNTINLTLSGASGAELATFAGDVTLSEGKLTITDTANENAALITTSATDSTGVGITASSLTTGYGLNVYSNSSDGGGFALISAVNDNTSATAAVCLRMQQDAANAFVNFVGTAAANTTDPISTFATPGALQGWAQVDINGAKRWIPFYADPSA